jgi:magnesium transporter
MATTTTRKRSQKTGLPPGTLVHVGESRTEKARISIFHYGPEQCREHPDAAVADILAYRRQNEGLLWVNVDGVHDVELVEAIGREFGVHPLVLEDIVNTHQRPKLDELNSDSKQAFLVFKMLTAGEAKLQSEQVSVLLGPDYVISFQERPGDVFEPVRTRLRTRGTRLRAQGCDFLAYALLDAVVDGYFTVLEGIGDATERLDEELINHPGPPTLRRIRDLKLQLIALRKAAWPLREAIGAMDRSLGELIRPETRPYLRDVYDHCIQVIDAGESQRDIVGGMMDIYLSSVSNRMNEIMKVLTIIATIFMPLSFIAGVYGMNFQPEASPLNMPELGWYWGYPFALSLMAVMAVVMLIFFRRKRWL